MKRRVAGMLVIAGLLAGCQAFNDHNEEGKFLGSLGLPVPEGAGGDAGAGSVLCSPSANVVVRENSSAAVADSMIWDVRAVTTVTQLDESTIMVSVAKEQLTVSFGLRKADATVTACGVSVKLGDTDLVVEQGAIDVGQLNVAAQSAVLNAGTFVMTVLDAPSASKAVKTLLGAKADEQKSVLLDGSYSADSVVPAAKKEEK